MQPAYTKVIIGLFFERLGKLPAFLLITFLMVIIGPFAGIPRTAMTTLNTVLPYLTEANISPVAFNVIYCSIVFVLGYRESKTVEILGYVLSPIKIISFTTLVGLGLFNYAPTLLSVIPANVAFKTAIIEGYNTMDMVAAFFFCSVAVRAIKQGAKTSSTASLTSLTLKACLTGGALLSAVYIGFMLVAHNHAAALQSVDKAQMIGVIATIVLGKFGGLFVCIAVSFACIATALALAEISSHYLQTVVFKNRAHKNFCLSLVMLITLVVSNFEFQTLMDYMTPVLGVLYPALIVLCIMNILHKLKGIKSVQLPVMLSVIGSVLSVLYLHMHAV